VDLFTIFVTTFGLVFIGELGDKTQIAAGTGTLANKNSIRIIFFSSSLALIVVAGLTVFFAGLIPDWLVPAIEVVGGIGLILYGIYLYRKADGPSENDEELLEKNNHGLFFSHFSVVFVAELGDKTQIATLAVAVENQSYLLLVFTASASALVAVTGLTVWGITKVPTRLVKKVQQTGAALMVAYGVYMLYSAT
jgi:putative Ca2+/H+ antiporter (TMEM165/GDT1 family)